MEDFVSYELAKKLKEKGFNEPCYMYYDEEGNLKQNIEYDPMNSGIGIDHLLVRNSCKWAIVDCVCPTIPQVLKWLREEKKIYLLIGLSMCGYRYDVQNNIRISRDYADMYNWDNVYLNGEARFYKSYEQAALAGIVSCLDNLIIEE